MLCVWGMIVYLGFNKIVSKRTTQWMAEAYNRRCMILFDGLKTLLKSSTYVLLCALYL